MYEPPPPPPPWENLPDLVLESVTMRLDTPLTFSSFASVCRSWRSISKSCKRDFIASQPPLLISFPSFSKPTNSARVFFLSGDRCFNGHRDLVLPVSLLDIHKLLGHSHGHLIGLDRSNRGAPVLINARTGDTTRFPCSTRETWNAALLTSPPTSSDCLLLLHNLTFMQYCPVNGLEWQQMDFPKGNGHARDLVAHGNKLYIWFGSNQIDVMDINGGSFRSLRVIRPIEFMTEKRLSGDRMVFVVSGDELLWMRDRNMEFESYKFDLLDEGEGGWVRMEGLGGRTVFGGGGYERGAYAGRGLKVVKENCLFDLSWGYCGPYCFMIFVKCIDDGKTHFPLGGYISDGDHVQTWLHSSDFEKWGLI